MQTQLVLKKNLFKNYIKKGQEKFDYIKLTLKENEFKKKIIIFDNINILIILFIILFKKKKIYYYFSNSVNIEIFKNLNFKKLI